MRLALLGTPLGHSRSPRIHRAALAACGIAGEYEAREVDAAGFAAACGEIARGAPRRRQRHHALQAGGPRRLRWARRRRRRRAGAVNTLARRPTGVWRGGTPMWRRSASALAALPDGAVLVLGAGGAAAAALVAAAGRRRSSRRAVREAAP